MNYQPRIDGLRAIAVWAVIIYHANLTISGFSLFSGGYLGVDIFFVISGYLITNQIKTQLDNGNFSLLKFFIRRSRRILPALFFLFFVLYIYSYFKSLPEDFISFSKQSIFSSLFSSNLYFYFNQFEYQNASSQLLPLLHTWSLSIEEQYYIIYPVILLAVYKLSKNSMSTVIFALFLFSFTYSLYLDQVNKTFSFFSIQSRFWELAVGCLLALKIKTTPIYLLKKNILIYLGILLIIISFILFDDESQNRTLLTLVPIIGTILIILSENSKNYVTKILSSNIFIYFGIISYSLYLWHYPIFAFSRLSEFATYSISNKIILILLLLSLANLSYFIIEKPFRNKLIINNKIFFFIITSFFVTVISANLISINKNGFIDRYPEYLQDFLVNNYQQLSTKELNNLLNKRDNTKKIFLLGDSHMAGSFFNQLKKKYSSKYSIINLASGGCIFVNNFNRVDLDTNKIYENCSMNSQKKRKDIVLNNENSIVLIGGRWPYYLNNSYYLNEEIKNNPQEIKDSFIPLNKNTLLQNEIISSIKSLDVNNNKIILIYPVPEVGFNVPKNIIKNYDNLLGQLPDEIDLNQIQKLSNEILSIPYKDYFERSKSSFDLLDSIESVNIYRIYPHLLFCNTIIDYRCVVNSNDHIYYNDDHHISSIGSQMIIEKLSIILSKFN